MLEIIIVILVTISSVRSCGTRNDVIAENVTSDITNGISFQYYGGKTVYDFTKISFKCGLSILDQVGYEPSLQTIFYLHGWSEKPSQSISDESIVTIADAFLKYEKTNFIAVNYENLVQGNANTFIPFLPLGIDYIRSVHNATYIGHALGYFLTQFLDTCNCEKNVHLIGFSIGAQIIHSISEVVGAERLKRVTALDAAGVLYEAFYHKKLARSDAVFIDAVHTDGGGLGYASNFATVDFYPNGGRGRQPHCSNVTLSNSSLKYVLTCNHYMAPIYYAESVKDKKAFPSYNSSICAAYDCTGDAQTYMGYAVDTNIKGNLYLTTNRDAPYGKG